MPKRVETVDLSQRERGILKTLIKEYVHSGKPVGSRRLAKISREHLSPATIRNVMADLEEMGFVTQPHTSAGRVPTDKGYRFYVDSLAHTRELSDKEASRIKEILGQAADPDELMNIASQVLSSASQNVGFVVAPPVSQAVMKHINFVKISTHRILVILVSLNGHVHHQLVQIDEDLPQSDLDQAAHYLVEHFEGQPLRNIRDRLLELMGEEKALYDRLLRNVVLLGTASLLTTVSEAEEKPELYVGSTSQIIQKPELADVSRMILLFQTFEEKSRLVKILTECLKVDETGPVVTIGLEKHIPGLREWALISSTYPYNQGMGTLGILGPSRMEYEKAISLVDYVAKLFGKILSSN